LILVAVWRGAVQGASVLTAKFGDLLPHLNERAQRPVLGAGCWVLGRGGIEVVARAAAVNRGRVSRGVQQVTAGTQPSGRVRQPGAGRKPDTTIVPNLVPALEEPGERGIRCRRCGTWWMSRLGPGTGAGGSGTEQHTLALPAWWVRSEGEPHPGELFAGRPQPVCEALVRGQRTGSGRADPAADLAGPLRAGV
jgi:hypothetical protein